MSFKIEKSVCEKWIRITLGNSIKVIPIGEWSHILGRPGVFKIIS
jgi:hypothetical protein